MVIPTRIKTIGDFIESGDVLVDVGADHGLLELYLIAKYPDIKVTAVENKIGPYQILEENLKAYKNVKLSFSDGIECVSRQTNTVVIAGMGGLNIVKILSRYPEKTIRLQKIVIDAHRDIEIARRTIVSFGFKIKQEKIVFEQDKFYVVSEFVKTINPPVYSNDVMQIGYKLYKDKLWPKYKEYLISKNNQTIGKIKHLEYMQDIILNLEKLNERIVKYGKN